MLTDEQITEALAHIDKRYQKVCRMYLEKVGATIRELGHLNSSRLNLLVQLQKMGVSEQQIIRELQRTTDLTKQDIRRLYHKAAAKSVEDARYLYLAKGKAPDWQPMEYLVQAMCEQTAGKLDNLSGTTAVGKAYRQIVDEAVTAVTMGVEDYNSAIRNSLRLLGRAGLQTEYESGHHRRLESAVRQNVIDGVRQVQQEAQKLIGEQIGADGVEITAHPHSAPDHEPVQGRQFPIAEFEKMQSGSDFQDADGKHYSGFQRPITQWRCRHLVYYILLGAAKPMYSDEQLKKWEEENHKGCEIDGKHYTRYEATQLMRKLETEIRKEKDTILLAQASGDDVLRRSSQTRVTQLTAKYGQVAESAGLRTRFERTKVEGYSPKHAKEATDVANTGHRAWLKSIGAEMTTLNSIDKYEAAKYNNSREYQLLEGYSKAVAKGDIHALTGFELYQKTGSDIQSKIVGTMTQNGVEIKSFTTHFIDRVIGQTSEPHKGMRCGVSVENVLDALTNPVDIGKTRTFSDGDIRQTFTGKRAKVTLSIRDNRLIQANPYNPN